MCVHVQLVVNRIHLKESGVSHYAILLQQWNGRNMASGETNQRVWPDLVPVAGVQLGSVTFCGVADLGVYLFHVFSSEIP